MREIIPAENAKKSHILTGTVRDINEEDFTLKIFFGAHIGTRKGIPVFYRCNGTDKMNGMPFVVNDEVIVLNQGDPQNLAAENMKVIGFSDGLPKVCRFYIRPTFNGFQPVLGGEGIKLENKECSETCITESINSSSPFAGLCGPFTYKVGSGNESICLNYLSFFGSHCPLYHHFYESPADEAEIHVKCVFEEAPGDFEVNYLGVTSEETPFHLNRVYCLRHNLNLSECSRTNENINKRDYVIYQVNFTNLCMLSLTKVTYNIVVDRWCNSCGVIPGSPPPKEIRPNLEMIESILPSSGVNDRGGYYCLGAPLLPSGVRKTIWWDTITNCPIACDLVIEQLCILSDENGQNPSYSDFTIDTSLFAAYIWIFTPLGGGTMCEIRGIDFPGFGGYTYTKMLTPEDNF